MVIAVNDKWVWDSWYAREGDIWHAYFLQANKSLGDPDLRHWNVTQGHATSKDLKNWDHLGETFAPASSPAWDDCTTWTGSVVEDNGIWHLFYTGTSHAEDGMYQRIGHATSTDMHNWTRVDDGLCLDIAGPNAAAYQQTYMKDRWHDRAMRDPWVMKDPDGDGWLMYFTARLPKVDEPNEGGSIGFATSADLMHWELQEPVYSGGYGQLEVPQVLEIDNTWYCLFCTAAEHWSQATIKNSGEVPVTGNHYLIGDSARGPWRLPDGPFLDGAQPAYRYAARIVKDQTGHRLLGFLDTGKENFQGVICNPVYVEKLSSGLLQLSKEL